jgi:hypothetical protein
MEGTSLEQSKELLNAGLSRESADLWWIQRYVAEWVGNDEEGKAFEHHVVPVTYLSFVNEGLYDTSQDKVVVTPAWSLGRLLRMFKAEEGKPAFRLVKGGYIEGEDGDNYISEWFAIYEQIGDGEFYYCENDKSAVTAVGKLIIKLKQEGVEV